MRETGSRFRYGRPESGPVNSSWSCVFHPVTVPGNERNQSLCDGLLAVRADGLLPFRPEDRDGILVAVETQPRCGNVVGYDHIQFLALHLVSSVAGHIGGRSEERRVGK